MSRPIWRRCRPKRTATPPRAHRCSQRDKQIEIIVTPQRAVNSLANLYHTIRHQTHRSWLAYTINRMMRSRYLGISDMHSRHTVSRTHRGETTTQQIHTHASRGPKMLENHVRLVKMDLGLCRFCISDRDFSGVFSSVS